MTSGSRVRILMVGAACLWAASAAAQAGPAAHDWGHGTILSVSAGAGFDGTHTGAAAGVGLGWEILPWFGLEGTGTWIDRGRDSSAFAATMKGEFGLLPGRRAVPFVEGGVGLYRLSFTGDHAVMPEFYRRRLTARVDVPARITAMTDPSLVVGAGVNLFITQHLWLRPGVDTTFVMRDSQTYQVTTAAIRLTYHFEDHPITPSR